MEPMEVSRKIMEYLGAFKGSKPVVHNSEAMLIRAKAEEKLKPEEFTPKLEELFKDLDIQPINPASPKARTMTDQVDATFRNTTEVEDESLGIAGIEQIKQSFEMTGFEADYLMGELEDMGVYVVMYMDKSGFGPMFVETMVVKLHPLDEE
ncbi:MAG: DUF2120 domain-containing protein [Methanosphaera sp.]|nr:DUF2120 domain-containing protein [Methanosphaera sp.]